MTYIVTSEQERMRFGYGPVATQLKERDRLQALSKLHQHYHNGTLQGCYVPAAKALIEWTRPYDGETTEDDVVQLLKCNLIEKLNKQFSYIKTFQYLRSKFLFKVTGLSGTHVSFQFTLSKIDIIKDWYHIEVFDALENVTYRGDFRNINLSELKNWIENISFSEN